MPITHNHETNTIAQINVIIRKLEETLLEQEDIIVRINRYTNIARRNILQEECTQQLNNQANELIGNTRQAIQDMKRTNELLKTISITALDFNREYHECIRLRRGPQLENGW